MMWSSALPRVLAGVVATGLSVSLLAQSPQSVPPAAAPDQRCQ